MTRIAAVADVHINEASRAEWAELLDTMSSVADMLVLAGDLTNRGLPREAEVLAEGIAHLRRPVIAVLGNHDFEAGQHEEIVRILCDAGIVMLDEEPCEIGDVGFAGGKGFCGGFDRHALAPFGEDLIKRFVRDAVDDALRLESGLARLRTKHRIVVLHYSPIRQTVEGEPLEIFPFLGSSRLADPVDHFDVTAVFHGHAHHGSAEGQTAGGTPVYNVALPLRREIDPENPFYLLEL